MLLLKCKFFNETVTMIQFYFYGNKFCCSGNILYLLKQHFLKVIFKRKYATPATREFNLILCHAYYFYQAMLESKIA